MRLWATRDDVDGLQSLFWRYIPWVGNPIEGMAGQDIGEIGMGYSIGATGWASCKSMGCSDSVLDGIPWGGITFCCLALSWFCGCIVIRVEHSFGLFEAD